MMSLDFRNLLTNIGNPGGWSTYDRRLSLCATIIANTLKVVKDTLKIDFYDLPSLCSKCQTRAADTVFLIDSSSRIGSSNFYNQVIPFLNNVVSALEIASDKIHSAVV